MNNFIVSFMSEWGYFAITLLITLENVFPPIPSEVILTFGGFMTNYSSLNLILVIIFSIIGSLVSIAAALTKTFFTPFIDGTSNIVF